MRPLIESEGARAGPLELAVPMLTPGPAIRSFVGIIQPLNQLHNPNVGRIFRPVAD